MKITTLELTSFRSFLNYSMAMTARRVLVVGLNASGKTSIREALRWGFLGVCQGTDAKGAGVEALIPTMDGAHEVSVALRVEGLGKVTRSGGGKTGTAFAVEGFTGTASVQQAALLDRLQTSEAFLQAALDSSVFLRLHHADAKGMVLTLLNVRIRLENDAHEYSLAELDDIYGQAYDKRKVEKRVLQGMPRPVPPAVEEHPQADAVELKLVELRKTATAFTEALGATRQRRRALQQRIDDLQSRTDYPGPLPEAHLASRIDETEKQLTALEEGFDAADNPQLKEPEVGDPKRVQFIKNRVDALDGHSPGDGCVLDPDVPCETARVRFTKRAKILKLELAASRVDVVPPVTQNPVRQLRKQLDEFREMQRGYEGASAVRAQQDTLKAELSSLPDTSAQEADLVKLEERISKGDGILKSSRAYQMAQERFERDQAAYVAKEQQIATLEATVQALGPTGVRVQALASAIGRFEQAVNSFTMPFAMSVKFTLDPWGVMVNDRPVETYSRSEQYRIGIAIQLAVAHLSGLSFAVIDELDCLDQANRDLVGKLIHEAPLDQIIVLSTRESVDKRSGQPIPLPTLPGWTAYRLEKQAGKSVIVERSAA